MSDLPTTLTVDLSPCTGALSSELMERNLSMPLRPQKPSATPRPTLIFRRMCSRICASSSRQLSPLRRASHFLRTRPSSCVVQLRQCFVHGTAHEPLPIVYAKKSATISELLSMCKQWSLATVMTTAEQELVLHATLQPGSTNHMATSW